MIAGEGARDAETSRVVTSRLLAAVALVSVAIGLGVACEEGATSQGSSTTSSQDAGQGFDVPGDGANFCGNEVHQVKTHPPLLYFVMDASGSMSEIAVGGQSRYALLKASAVDLVSTLGSAIRIGAAVFPAPKSTDSCAPGVEVLSARVGGSAATKAFQQAISVGQEGGTPTAATLEGLAPKFANASIDTQGPEAVLLVTDGGPNCDPAVSCTVAECIPNIDGACPPAIGDCCDPAKGGRGANCLDRVATLTAIQHVVQNGAKLYVIGLAPAAPYEGTLEQMALLGGAAQAGAPFYYRVDDLAKLEDTFKAIVANLISCEFTLLDPPKEQGLTNVYFDGAVVYQDAQNGWVWKGTDTIVLVGAACQELKSGAVGSVAVLSGCPTETPK
jgi:hypothetical protein